MSDFLEQHRALNGAAILIRRYFDHHVSRDSAALTYYLLFALFPLLIFLNNLVGLLSFDLDTLLKAMSTVIPRDVVDLVGQYLVYISRVSSQTLLWFSLVFTIYFPYRAVNALFQSVRKAYAAGLPTQPLRQQLRVLLYTLLFIVAIPLSVLASTISRRALDFVSDYVYLSDHVINLWSWLRFVILALQLLGNGVADFSEADNENLHIVSFFVFLVSSNTLLNSAPMMSVVAER